MIAHVVHEPRRGSTGPFPIPIPRDHDDLVELNMELQPTSHADRKMGKSESYCVHYVIG
jgi:hypothetical protein